MAGNGGLAGKVALITGAAHGQGRAAALAFAAEGAHVVLLDVAKQLDYPGYATGTPAELDAAAAECRALGVAALAFAADVRDDAAVSHAVAETVRQLGRVDVLFNPGGVGGGTPPPRPTPGASAATASPTNSPRRRGTRCSTSTSKGRGSSPGG